MEQAKIDRINALAKKAKSPEGLTPEETAERDRLRQEYIAAYRASLVSQLENTYIVEPDGTKRPPYEQVEAFVRRALERDCPVAFLNLHNGRVKELDYWHWVTITALEDTTAVILDSGSALRIDLRLWYETTKRRGGFVAALGDPA